jgi:hypothetical protein
VTKNLAGQLPEAGTVSTLFGRTGASAGLSSATVQDLQKILGPSVTAKAGANAAGQASELFRAALGNGAPSGLIGGYGGVLGSSFIGSELGGGKGFAETVAGDVKTSRQTPGSSDVIDTIFGGPAFSAGLGAAGRELRNELRDNLGPLGGAFGPKENVLNPTIEGPTAEQLKVQQDILNNFNEAVGRGTRAQGLGDRLTAAVVDPQRHAVRSTADMV